MKTEIIKQEILLIITAFPQKESCEKDAVNSFLHQSYAAQLEEACWNGVLDEWFDMIIEKTTAGKRPCLWHTQQRASFLELELCDDPQFTERHLSIDPYSFLPMVIQN